MFLSTKKFNKEIGALKALPAENQLHPLRKEQIKHRVLEAITAMAKPASKPLTWQERGHSLLRYLIAVVAGLSLVAGTAFAANGAKPGDPLFPVKKVTENIR